MVDGRPDALFVEQVLDADHRIEEARDRAAGISCKQMNAAFGLQGALEQQFAARKDFEPLSGEESRVDLHGGRIL